MLKSGQAARNSQSEGNERIFARFNVFKRIEARAFRPSFGPCARIHVHKAASVGRRVRDVRKRAALECVIERALGVPVVVVCLFVVRVVEMGW